MKEALPWSMIMSLLIVGASVHLCARPWSSRRLFFVDLGRELTDDDRARARRVMAINALVMAVGIATVLLVDGMVGVLVALSLPYLSIAALLREIARLRHTVVRSPVPTRFSVPVDDPPPVSTYLSVPLELANVALIVLGAGLFAWMLPRMPETIPAHWNAGGEIDRWGSPAELWVFAPLMLFDYGIIWMVALGVARERWALPGEEQQRYVELQLERRRLIVRLLEIMMLGINAGMLVTWLGIAWGGIPGHDDWHEIAVTLSLALMGLAIVAPLGYFLPRMTRVQEKLRELGGSDVLGTRADGWRLGGMIYWAPDDPAVFVPKRMGIGQTLNFARPGAWLLLAGITIVPIAITMIAIALAQ